MPIYEGTDGGIDPLADLRRAMLPMFHANARTYLRRSCRRVVEQFLLGLSTERLAHALGVGTDLVEDAIRWHMNKRDRLKRRARGKGRARV